MGGRVEVKGFETVIANLKSIPQRQKEHLEQSMNAAVLLLYETVMKKAELTDHDLTQLSHYFYYVDDKGKQQYIGAYSTKMGEDSGPHPDEMVHIQGGQLYQNIEKLVKLDDDKAVIAVGVRESKVPYIKWLINGTGKMRPRDFLGHAWLECRDQVVAIIKSGLVPGRTSRGGNVGR